MYKIGHFIILAGVFFFSGCAATQPIDPQPEQKLIRREFYITRHGQTDQNLLKIVGDDSARLTPQGKESAILLSNSFYGLFNKPEQEVYLVSSNLERAKESARLMARNSVKVIADSRLNERISGRLSTMPVEEAGNLIALLESNNLEKYLELMGTESSDSHISRILKGVNFHLQNAPRSKTVMFVSHLKSMLEIAQLAGYKAQYFDNSTLYYFKPCELSGWEISRIYNNNGNIESKQDVSCPE